jgi:hypothetical protein
MPHAADDARVEATLSAHWPGFELREPQRASVTATMRGLDALVIMATGGGKSLCLQVPALALGRPGLIVSPLISLMEDQVGALVRRGVKACLLGSAQTDPAVRADAWAGRYQVGILTFTSLCSPGIRHVPHGAAPKGSSRESHGDPRFFLCSPGNPPCAPRSRPEGEFP